MAGLHAALAAAIVIDVAVELLCKRAKPQISGKNRFAQQLRKAV